MKTFLKILLGGLIGVSLVCVLGTLIVVGGLRLAVTESTHADVEAASASIAEFELPDGFFGDYAANFCGVTLAAYRGGDPRSHLFLAQAPGFLPIGESGMANLFRQSVVGRRDDTTRLRMVELRPVTVRGQETRLMISDGVSSEGGAYREAVVVFQGQTGPAALIYSEPLGQWNEAELMALVGSLQ